MLKHRRHAIAKINDYTGLTFVGEANHLTTAMLNEESNDNDARTLKSNNSSSVVVVDDLKSYRLFKTLFESKRNAASGLSGLNSDENVQQQDEVRKLSREEELLDEFQEEYRRLHMASEEALDPQDAEKEAEFERLQDKLREARMLETVVRAVRVQFCSLMLNFIDLFNLCE